MAPSATQAGYREAQQRHQAQTAAFRASLGAALDLKDRLERHARRAGPSPAPSSSAVRPQEGRSRRERVEAVLAQEGNQELRNAVRLRDPDRIRRALDLHDRIKTHSNHTVTAEESLWAGELSDAWERKRPDRPGWTMRSLTTFLLGGHPRAGGQVSALCRLPRDILEALLKLDLDGAAAGPSR